MSMVGIAESLKSSCKLSNIHLTEPASGSARLIAYPRRVFFWVART